MSIDLYVYKTKKVKVVSNYLLHRMLKVYLIQSSGQDTSWFLHYEIDSIDFTLSLPLQNSVD